MINNLLEDLKVLDLTSRLPGPLSTYILHSLGADITKVENTDIGADPFNHPEYLKHAPHFKNWYDSFNKNKKVIKISFKQSEAKLNELIQIADIIFIPDNSYFQNLIDKCQHQVAIVKLSGGKDQWRSLHDLNALALTKTFKEHCKNSQHPPYLPFAGINFAQYLATTALALRRKVERKNDKLIATVYLKDVTELIFDSMQTELINANNRFLHDGAFPCYNIYKSEDDKTICLAAVEEKYWTNLVNTFNFELDLADRFDKSSKTYQYLKNSFAKLHSNEINKQIKKTPMCLTIVED